MYSALQVVTAPVVEPVSVALAKQHCRIDNDADDGLVGVYIATARAMAEAFTGRALITQTLLWTIAQAYPPGGWPMANVPVSLLVWPQWVTPNMIGQRPLVLPRQPLQSVTSVNLTDSLGNVTALDQSDAVANIATGQIRLTNVPGLALGGSLAVEFVAGYGADGSTVPGPLVNAILLMTAALYEHRGDDDGELPRAAQTLLTPYRLVTFG